jgi:cell division protein FtsL
LLSLLSNKKEGKIMSNCSKCGKEVAENSSFCGYCGNKITDSPTAHPSSPNAASPGLEEKKRSKTIMTIAILGGIVIALIIIALVMSKSNISNKTAMTGTNEANQGMNSEEQVQADSQNDYPESMENTGSMEPRILQRDGIVADGRPFIETDKDVYYYGEQIRVHYYNAPGYARDWICIVPAGSRNTAVGNFHYIPRGGRGQLLFRSPRPGRYEARAFYSYSPLRYIVSARYGFTVEDRPANY